MEPGKFHVTIKLSVETQGQAGNNPFTGTTLEYHDMSHEGVSAIERALIKTLSDLRDFGDKVLGDRKPKAA